MTHDHVGEDDAVVPVEADAQDLLHHAHEIARTRATQLGTPLPAADGRKIMVLVDEASQVLGDVAATGNGTSMAELMRGLLREARDPRATVFENCPVCGGTPRWYDGSMFGCYGCSATSTSFVGKLLPMTDAQRREAVELAIAHGREDITAFLRASEQVYAATLRLRFEPADNSRTEIQADAQVHVWQSRPGVYFVVVRSHVASAEGAEYTWADEHIAITHYDLTGPHPVRRVSTGISAAAGVPQSTAHDLATFHRTLSNSTTTWVEAIPELRDLDAPLLPAQRGWRRTRT